MPSSCSSRRGATAPRPCTTTFSRSSDSRQPSAGSPSRTLPESTPGSTGRYRDVNGESRSITGVPSFSPGFAIHDLPSTLPIPELAANPEKTEIRRRVLAAREALAPGPRREFAALITLRLLALPRYRDARCVMAYAGFGSEFDTVPFVSDVLAQRKSLVMPRVERSTHALRLHAVRDPATE